MLLAYRPAQHVKRDLVRRQPVMLLQFRRRAGGRTLLDNRREDRAHVRLADQLAVRPILCRAARQELRASRQRRVTLGHERRAVLRLGVAVLGAELVRLLPDLVGERLTLQPADFVQALPNLRTSQRELLPVRHD